MKENLYNHSDIHPTILRTCRQIFAESFHILYSRNIFSRSTATYLKDLGDSNPYSCHNLGFIRHLELNQETGDSKSLQLHLQHLVKCGLKLNLDTMKFTFSRCDLPKFSSLLPIINSIDAFDVQESIEVVVSGFGYDHSPDLGLAQNLAARRGWLCEQQEGPAVDPWLVMDDESKRLVPRQLQGWWECRWIIQPAVE